MKTTRGKPWLFWPKLIFATTFEKPSAVDQHVNVKKKKKKPLLHIIFNSVQRTHTTNKKKNYRPEARSDKQHYKLLLFLFLWRGQKCNRFVPFGGGRISKITFFSSSFLSYCLFCVPSKFQISGSERIGGGEGRGRGKHKTLYTLRLIVYIAAMAPVVVFPRAEATTLRCGDDDDDLFTRSRSSTYRTHNTVAIVLNLLSFGRAARPDKFAVCRGTRVQKTAEK